MTTEAVIREVGDIKLQIHDLEQVAREFIGEHYGFTWQEESRNIDQVELQVKRTNRDNVRQVYHFEGTAMVSANGQSDPLPKRFILTVVMNHVGAVIDRHGQIVN